MTLYTPITNGDHFPDDEYLTKEQLTELYNKLVDEANVIYKNTLKAMNELTETQELDPDGLDIAVSASNRELSLRIADRERKMLNKIRTSMGRLKEGEYGSCLECGDPIGYPRLMFRPVATMCIDCKTEQEQIEEGTWRA